MTIGTTEVGIRDFVNNACFTSKTPGIKFWHVGAVHQAGLHSDALIESLHGPGTDSEGEIY